VFKLCHQAALSWLAVPAENKVLATGSGVTTTGKGAIDSSNNWNAWTTGELDPPSASPSPPTKLALSMLGPESLMEIPGHIPTL